MLRCCWWRDEEDADALLLLLPPLVARFIFVRMAEGKLMNLCQLLERLGFDIDDVAANDGSIRC